MARDGASGLALRIGGSSTSRAGLVEGEEESECGDPLLPQGNSLKRGRGFCPLLCLLWEKQDVPQGTLPAALEQEGSQQSQSKVLEGVSLLALRGVAMAVMDRGVLAAESSSGPGLDPALTSSNLSHPEIST